jgi:hypothetical protein
LQCFVAGLWQGFPDRVRAPHRGAFERWCVGLFWDFILRPPFSIDVADNGLGAGVDVDMLNPHCLIATAAAALKSLHLRRKRAHKFVAEAAVGFALRCLGGGAQVLHGAHRALVGGVHLREQ